MKPRLFIGSSTESLDVAHALQASLDYDADVTVWNQGVFSLSSDALSDLLYSLDKFDFAIFIFLPTDLTIIRNTTHATVRDNVIFELGLFLGRLGRERVFYLTDRNTTDLHLPTDLLGVMSGDFNSQRDDGNIKAALGKFSQDIKLKFKDFVIENLIDFKDEPTHVKRIALDKPLYWEFLLASELLNIKLAPINKSYKELQDDRVVQRKAHIGYKDLFQFVRSSLATFQSMAAHFKSCLAELQSAFGPPGQPGNPLEIKNAVDHTVQICKELLAWEYDVNGMVAPQGLEVVITSLKGWSRIFIDDINTIAPQTMQMVYDDKAGIKPTPITLTLRTPEGMLTIVEPFEKYILDNNITDNILL